MFATLSLIVTHTPAWVWAALAALVLAGLRQTRTHDVSATRVWLVPALLGTLSLLGALRGFAHAGEILTGAGWAAGALLGFASNRVLALPRQVQANADGSFRVAGSVAPLLLFVGVFMIRYVVNVALALQPGLSGNVGAALVAAAAYGLSAGLFAARARRIWAARGPAAGFATA